MKYKVLEKTVLEAREQLLLFEVKQAKKKENGQQIEIENWDFADADTKIETHGFHSYPAMMIPQIARSLIGLYGKEKQTLLDPFCGSGTALVETKLFGLNSYGIDINPLALLLARVKSTPLPIDELKKYSIKLCDRYLKAQNELTDVQGKDLIPKFFNIEYWFHPKVSRDLFILRSIINRIRDIRIREFFLVAFSQTVRDSSYTRSGEFKLFRIPEEQLANHRPNVPGIFFKIVERNMRGMADFSRKAKRDVFVKVLDEDTRHKTSIPSKCIDLVVTSPPYGDSRTTVAYGQFSRLSLQWLGLPWERVKNIDKNSLGGTKFSDISILKYSDELKNIFEKIKKYDKDRAEDVTTFFADFRLCLTEINRVCKKGATCCFVVGNRTVKGIKIPTDKILTEMSMKIGLHHIETIERNIPNKTMPLKNSPTNIEGKLGETMTKEHIIVLKKTSEAAVD